MALIGTEILQVQAVTSKGAPAAGTEQINLQQILNLHATSVGFNTNTATAGATLTAANILGGTVEVYLALTGTLAGAANAQLPTVASMVTAAPDLSNGDSYSLRIINESAGAYTWTVTTNTGWTLTGTMTIAQNTWRDFVVTMTSATTATLQAVGTGTHS